MTHAELKRRVLVYLTNHPERVNAMGDTTKRMVKDLETSATPGYFWCVLIMQAVPGMEAQVLANTLENANPYL